MERLFKSGIVTTFIGLTVLSIMVSLYMSKEHSETEAGIVGALALLLLRSKDSLIGLGAKDDKSISKVTKSLYVLVGRDAPITGFVAEGKCDIAVFSRDLLDKNLQETDISMLMRICDVHDVPLAKNLASSNLLFRGGN
jgi:hypothetical protein